MWNFKYKDAYQSCVWDILDDPAVQSMRLLPQHAAGVSCYHHSVLVSYVSFRLCAMLGLDARAAARGGLLHDLYLCNWSQTNIGPWKRLLIHPQIALRNAEIHGLSDLEKDIISKHMWPLTLRKVPRHRESVVVNLADKICACTEMLRLYSKIGAAAALAKYNLCKPLFPQSVV